MDRARYRIVIVTPTLHAPSHFSVYTGTAICLTGRIFYLCNPFTRNPANSVTDCSTVYRSKTCTVLWESCKRKADPCKFLSDQIFVQTPVKGVSATQLGASTALKSACSGFQTVFLRLHSLCAYWPPSGHLKRSG